MKRAVIDIGSNSVRLMVQKNGVISCKLTETTRLSGKMIDGMLDSESITRTVTAVKNFYNYAESVEGVTPLVFATAAVRMAKNRSEFLDKFAFEIDVISGETEAQIGFVGASLGIAGSKLLVDIGGASTEVVIGYEDIKYAHSFPVGVVTLQAQFGENYIDIDKYVHSLMPKDLDIPRFDIAVGIGGTILNLGAVINGIVPYDCLKVHRCSFKTDELFDCCKRLKTAKIDERVARGVDSSRADLIVTGGFLLYTVLKFFGAQRIMCSESDNLEGYLACKI